MLTFYVVIGITTKVGAQSLDVSKLVNESIESYKQSELDTAVYNLELAALLRPYDQEIASNLKVAKGKLAVDIVEIPSFFLSRWLAAASDLFMPGVWKYIAICIMLLIAVLLYQKLVKRTESRTTSWTVLCLLCVLLMVVLILGKARFDRLHEGRYGIIMGNEVTALKQGPDDVSKDVKDISAGVKLEILDSSGAWYKVSAMDKEQGWIPQHAVKIIKVDE